MDSSAISYLYEHIERLKSRTKCKKKKKEEEENEIRIKKNYIIFLYKQAYIRLAIQRDGIL